MALSGFINLLKPPGMSSHDVVGFVRKVLKEKRVGHAGTLDPAAAGVLPIAVGQAARLIEYLEITDKAYRAEISLGVSTDSGDDTGEVLARQDFVMPAASVLEAALAKFRGPIRQVPPAHSAIKSRQRGDYPQAGTVVLPDRQFSYRGGVLQGHLYPQPLHGYWRGSGDSCPDVLPGASASGRICP